MSKKQFFIGYTTDDSQRLFENGRIPRNFESNGVGYSSIKSARNGIAKVRREEADKHPREFGVYDGWAEPIINPVMDGLEFVPCVYCEL